MTYLQKRGLWGEGDTQDTEGYRAAEWLVDLVGGNFKDLDDYVEQLRQPDLKAAQEGVYLLI